MVIVGLTITARAAGCDGVREMPVASALWQDPEVREHFRARPALAEVFAANACRRKAIPLSESEIEQLLDDLKPPQAIYEAARKNRLALDYLYATLFYEFADQSAPGQAAKDDLVRQLLAADPTQCFDDRERRLGSVLLGDPSIKKYFAADRIADARNGDAQELCRELKKAEAPGGTEPAAVKLRLAAEEAGLDWRGVVAAMAEQVIKHAAR